MSTYARIVDNGVVEIIQPHPDGFPLAERFPAEFVEACRALSAEDAARVQPGWHVEGASYAPPPDAPGPAPIRVIRSLAFRERMPAAKRTALSVAAMQAAGAGDGTLLTFLLDQASSVETDLDDPRVQGGVQQLLAAGLLTDAEADAMLADGAAEERP